MPDHGETVPFDEAMAIVRRAAMAMSVGAETLRVAETVGRILAAALRAVRQAGVSRCLYGI